MTNMIVTLKQIARHANCSVMTVSNVLNDKGDLYRPEMRERVIRTAQKLGYRPNTSARAAARKSVCLSNLKQIHTASYTYAADTKK